MATRKIEQAMLLPLGEDASLLDHVKDLRPLTDLVLPDEPRGALDRILAENYRAADLQARGLRPANRLLFRGPPGCGKTVAAGGLALALGIPLVVVRLDGLIDQYLGNTSKNLRKVIDFAHAQRVVLFLDEVDAIGRARNGRLNDVAEMNRITNSLLVMLEGFAVQARPSPSLLVAATNHQDMLDVAMERRFDQIVPEAHRHPGSGASEAAGRALRHQNDYQAVAATVEGMAQTTGRDVIRGR